MSVSHMIMQHSQLSQAVEVLLQLLHEGASLCLLNPPPSISRFKHCFVLNSVRVGRCISLVCCLLVVPAYTRLEQLLYLTEGKD